MLCRDILTDPIRVVVGELGEVRISFLPAKICLNYLMSTTIMKL